MRLAGSTPRNGARKYGVERYADIHGKLKPAFIHHSESKRHQRELWKSLAAVRRRPILTYPECAAPTLLEPTGEEQLVARICREYREKRLHFMITELRSTENWSTCLRLLAPRAGLHNVQRESAEKSWKRTAEGSLPIAFFNDAACQFRLEPSAIFWMGPI